MTVALYTFVYYAALLFRKMTTFVEHSTKDNAARVFLACPSIERFLKPQGLVDTVEFITEGGELRRGIAILTGKGTIGLCAFGQGLVEFVDAETEASGHDDGYRPGQGLDEFGFREHTFVRGEGDGGEWWYRVV